MFRELSGAVAVRDAEDGSSTGTPLNPPVLSGAFRTLNANAEVSRSGYLFKMFLPDENGNAVEETQSGDSIDGDLVTSDLAETTWCAYAWPANYSTSGNRTFFVNQTGDITTTDSSAYSGTGDFDEASSGRAFSLSSGTAAGNITGSVAVGTVGRDNLTWKQVN